MGKFSGRGLAPAKKRDLDIFVGGCSVESSEQELLDYCEEKNIPQKGIERLLTKSTWHQPYKLTVAAEDRDRLLSPELWPSGIFVRKFFKNGSGRQNNV